MTDQHPWTYTVTPHRVATWQSKYRVSVHRHGNLIGEDYADSKRSAKRKAFAIRENWRNKRQTAPETYPLRKWGEPR